MVQLYAVVTELDDVCIKWYVLLRSASMELAKIVLSAYIEFDSVQTYFEWVPHVVRISYTFDHVPYFGGTGKSDHRCSLGFLSRPIIIVKIAVENKWLRFRILSVDDCISSHGCQD